MRKRIFHEHNYSAIYSNGKTLRFAINHQKPITELTYPEFYDVKITSYCEGKCPYCYMDSKKTDHHAKDIIKKVDSFFGSMTPNQRPFQVAIGGGEPTSHPDFISLLKLLHSLKIAPNYTTNGMYITDEIVEATKEYSEGVAISCHPHLKYHWGKAIDLFYRNRCKLNTHHVISDKESIDLFYEVFTREYDKVDHFVLLPYTQKGRAKEKDIDWEYLIKVLSPFDTYKIAFGAGFYPYLCNKSHSFNVSLYEPEIMSKFLDLKDMKIYRSSFDA